MHINISIHHYNKQCKALPYKWQQSLYVFWRYDIGSNKVITDSDYENYVLWLTTKKDGTIWWDVMYVYLSDIRIPGRCPETSGSPSSEMLTQCCFNVGPPIPSFYQKTCTFVSFITVRLPVRRSCAFTTDNSSIDNHSPFGVLFFTGSSYLSNVISLYKMFTYGEYHTLLPFVAEWYMQY